MNIETYRTVSKINFARAFALGIITLAAILVPTLLYKDGDVAGVATALNVLLLCLLAYSISKGQVALSLFNSVSLFLVCYPFILQYYFGVDLSGHGFVRPLSFRAAAIYILYLFVVTVVATRNDRIYPRGGGYRVRSSMLAVGASLLVLGSFVWWFGRDALVMSRFEQYIDDYDLPGFLKFLRDAVRIIPFWLAYMVAASRKNDKRSPVSLSFILILMVGIILCNPYNSARFYSLSALLLAALPIISYYKVMRWLPALFPMIMIVILPVTSQLRYGLENMTFNNVVSIFYSLEFSALQVLNDGFHFLDLSAWGLGYYLISSILIFVPREFWPEKNPGTGSMIGDAGMYPISNVGVSPHFDAYLDFGVAGVIFFGVVVGIVMRKAHAWSVGGDLFGDYKSDFAALFLCLIPIFVRGDLSVFFIALYSFLLAYFASRLFVGLANSFVQR